MALKRAIALSGTHTSGMPVVYDEDKAGEAILPGIVVSLNSSGNYVKNTANAANVARNFALERDELGKDIDTAYALNDRIKVGAFCQGQRALAWIASGENVTVGDYLTTDAAGRLTKTSVSATVRIAQALESVNNTPGPGDARIRVVVI